MTLPLNSAIEDAFVTYLQGVTFTGLSGSNIQRYLQPTEVTTPAAFIVASQDQERIPNSGIYRIPVSVRLVYTAADLISNPLGLDTLTNAVECSLTGSQQSINSVSTELFIFSITKPSHTLEIVEDMYHYSINVEAVCKQR